MNVKFAGLTLFIALACTLQLHAQSHKWCGVTNEFGHQIRKHLHESRREMEGQSVGRMVTTYVPVRFFMVAKSDGSGRPSQKLALSALCLLNEHYADQDIQFYLKEFKNINSNTIYSSPNTNSGGNAIANQMIYNAMNIFVVNETTEEGVLAYYQPDPGPSGNDWIVALQGYVDEKLVLTHEVGHFFSLNHTFFGWEPSGGWDPVFHGNPVGLTSPDGVTKNEFVNGTNCTNAGDDLCDTPADYMFPDVNCDYTLNAKDPNGQLVNPDIENFMNYVYNCGEYHFTEDQKEQIHNSLFSTARNYVRPNYTPNQNPVSGTPTITSPTSGSTVDTYNYVELEWSALSGADKYLIEVTTTGVPSTRYTSNTNSIVLTDLEADKTYLWKVMGYNEYFTCGNFSSQKIFKTGNLANDTSETTGIESWSVSPNPVKIGTPVNLSIESSGMVAAVTVLDAMGRQMQPVANYHFVSGISIMEIPTDGWAPGFYLINVKTPTGSIVEKVAVVR